MSENIHIQAIKFHENGTIAEIIFEGVPPSWEQVESLVREYNQRITDEFMARFNMPSPKEQS